MQILSDRIIWDEQDLTNGLVVGHSNGMRMFGQGVAEMNNIDMFTVPGVANIGQLASSVGGSTGSIPSDVQIDATIDNAGNFAYLLGTKLNQIDVTTNTLTNNATFPHTITAHGGHASASGALGSVVLYHTGSTNYLFYAWGDNTDWDVGRFDLSATFVDNFMSTVPTTPLAAPDLANGQGKLHPMYVAQDDVMYIGSGRYVHAYNGNLTANGTFQAQVLDLPVGMEVTGFAENGYDLVIFATTGRNTGLRANAWAYFWSADRPDSFYKSVRLLDDDVSCPFSFGNTIGCFTRNRSSNQSVLRVFDGQEFIPKFYWTGSLPSVGGTILYNNMICWNSDGKIYQYGSYRGQMPIGTFQTLQGNGTTSGFLRSFLSGNLCASSGTGTSGGVDSFGAFGTGSFRTLAAAPNFPYGMKGKVLGLQVTLAIDGSSATGGRDLTIGYVNEANVVRNFFANVQNFSSSNLLFRYDYNNMVDKTSPFFSYIALLVTWGTGGGSSTAPAIRRLELFYEPVGYQEQTLT